jgi:tRNA(Ile)-lysidine synthase
LVGVSGGRDSVALLHWLIANGYRKLIVCHLDHHLRGRSSTADARFVSRLSETHGVPFETKQVDMRELARRNKHSIETASRNARYEFFAEVARRRRCANVFLGHHVDDLVETFLFNLFRGAGTAGQRSMQPMSQQRVGSLTLTILRPFLSASRADIDEYVQSNRIRFRDDRTNRELDATRNRIRHRIIPLLEKEFGRGIRNAIRRAAAIAVEEDALLDQLVPQQLPGAAKMNARELAALPIALQRRSIVQWLRARCIADVGFDMIERVRALLDITGVPAKVNLTGGRHARRRAGELFIE